MSKNFHIEANQTDCQTLRSPENEIQIAVDRGAHFALTIASVMNAHQTITARLAQDAQLDLTVVDLDCGGLVRQIKIELEEAGAQCVLSGLFIATGDERVENSTSIIHKAPHCQSQQKFHAIASDRATAVFNGLIYVAAGAQQTVAMQNNHNICLSDQAQIMSQPQLEIYADDVKCNHGATVGRRNEQAIFYMRQRGLSLLDAQALLLDSFALSVIDDRIEESIVEAITQKIHSL